MTGGWLPDWADHGTPGLQKAASEQLAVRDQRLAERQTLRTQFQELAIGRLDPDEQLPETMSFHRNGEAYVNVDSQAN